MKIVSIFSITMLLSTLAYGSQASPKDYQGTWKRTSGSEQACPAQLVITSRSKGEIEVDSRQLTSVTKIPFSIHKKMTGNYVRTVKKSKTNSVKKDYTLAGTYNTQIKDGKLISSHLWSSPEMKWQSTGIKTYFLDSAKKTITLEKAVMGYINEKGPNVDKKSIHTRFFTHADGHSLNATPFTCKFKK